MTSEQLIDDDSPEMKLINQDQNFDEKPIKLSKSYGILSTKFETNKFEYDANNLPTVSFKFTDKTNGESSKNFNENLNKYLNDQIEASDNFFNIDLRNFINDNKPFHIFIILKNEKEEKKIKLDRNHTKVKSYDWEYMSGEVKNKHLNFPDSTNVNEFLQDARRYHIVEIGILSEKRNVNYEKDVEMRYLFLFEDPIQLQDFVTKLKYNVFFSQQALANHFYNYICDLIFSFVLPSSDLMAFYKNIEIKKEEEIIINDTSDGSDKASSIFPFKDQVNKIEQNIRHDMAYYLEKPSKYNFEFFLKRFNYYEEDNYPGKYFNVSDDKALSFHCNQMKKELDEIVKNSQIYEKFFFYEMKKTVEKYISFKGVFNIDIVLNNQRNKNTVKNINKIYQCFKEKIFCIVNYLNIVFKCNEGFSHKHIQIFDYCYSFNEANIIHTFPAHYDSSQKNKIRIFDVLLKDEWTSKITSIIVYILHFQSRAYDDQYLVYLTKIIKNMRINIFDIYHDLVKELFDVFPSFKLFCKGYYKFSLKKYNYIDNVCHHFADYSIKTLLKNNFVKFSYDVIQENEIIIKNQDQLILCPVKNYFPKIDTLYEDCFILYDKELNDYLNSYEYRDKTLNKTFGTVDDFILKLKEIDSEMNRFSIMNLNLEDPVNLTNYKVFEESRIHEDTKTFPYAMYFNLYNFHKYNLIREIYDLVLIYKKNNNDNEFLNSTSEKILQLNELTFLVKNMTYKFYLYANYIRRRLDKKKINYSTTIGHYVIQINPDNNKEQNFYEDIYLDFKNKIN